MSGVIIEPFTSVEAAERNFARLNEAIVALQGGSIAIENIEGYENLATKLYVEEEIVNVRYAVGDVHISETDEDPENKFGYGEWQLISKGHCLVGVDVAPEDDPDYEVDQDFQSPGQTGGEKEHQLTVEELPAHSHEIRQFNEKIEKGDNYHRNRATSDSSVTRYMTSEETGEDEPHNNLQPYYCVYIWKRTA